MDFGLEKNIPIRGNTGSSMRAIQGRVQETPTNTNILVLWRGKSRANIGIRVKAHDAGYHPSDDCDMN